MLRRAYRSMSVFLSVITMITPIMLITPTASASDLFSEYPLSSSNAAPLTITTGPDGALWFTEVNANSIGRLTQSGILNEYSLPETLSEPDGITTGPDGALWFTEENHSKIGRITTSGSVTEYPLPNLPGSPYPDAPTGITSGPDGALWYIGDTTVGRVTTSGIITQYQIPNGLTSHFNITAGSDGALWFTIQNGYIGRVTTSGAFTLYPTPAPNADAAGITSGPDGALWFTDPLITSIGRITTSGEVTEFPIPSGADPFDITTGPDGALWFTEGYANQVARITTSGEVTEFPIPTSNSYPYGITSGPDGNIWFTEDLIGRIGRVDPAIALAPTPPTSLTASSPAQIPSLSWSASSAATSYNIYRNGINIATTAITTYTDSTAPEGTNTYYVTAVNSSGESGPSNSVNVLVDRTAPIVTGTPDSSPNTNGWYSHDVTINWNSVDPSPSSGAPSQPALTLANLEGDHTYTSDQSCDPVNNCDPGSLELKIDTTAPTIDYSVAPAPNSYLWNSGDVTVTFTCSDSLSGIDTCPAPVTVSTEGANQPVTGTATDKAGNIASATASINLDKTAPTITANTSQQPNTNGWFNSPVTVSYDCNDTLSGIATCSSEQTESSDGMYTLSGTAADKAGNSSNAATQVNIDQTSPDITYTVSPALNSSGWSTSNTVTVTFHCSDAASGINTCTDPVTVSGDGAYVVTGTATDLAGNTSSINALVGIDTTQPTITASVSPVPNANGWNNSGPVTVHFTCSDTLSGIASCPADQVESTEGSYTLSGTAVDNAGNTATTSVTVGLDTTAPTVTNVSWTSNPITQGSDTILSATVTDNLSDIASAYYTINGGTPQSMTYNTTTSKWESQAFGGSLAVGTYNIDVFASDNAGNSSLGQMDVLVVSNTTNGSVSGHAKIVPTPTDTLPIALDTATHNPTQMVVGFSATQGTTTSVDVHYIIKNNKDEFDFSSNSVDWVVIPDSMHASVLIHGDLTTYVNGVQTIKQNAAMRLDVVIGANGAADQVVMKIWNPGLDVNNTQPTYQSNDLDDSQQSNVVIR